MAVPPEAWLEVIGREYLGDFIPAGGGAMRFAVAEAAVLDPAGQRLTERAVACGLEVVAVDLAVLRLHILQNVVFALAVALPWETMLQVRLEALMVQAGYRWPDPGQPVLLPGLAEANGVAAHLLRRDLTQAFSREIWRDTHLTLDFRNAMIALLDARLTGEDPALADAVIEALRAGVPNRAAILLLGSVEDAIEDRF